VLDLPRDTPEFLFGTSCEEEVRGCHLDIFISRIDQAAKTCCKDENCDSPTYYVNPRRASEHLSRSTINGSFSAEETRMRANARNSLDARLTAASAAHPLSALIVYALVSRIKFCSRLREQRQRSNVRSFLATRKGRRAIIGYYFRSVRIQNLNYRKKLSEASRRRDGTGKGREIFPFRRDCDIKQRTAESSTLTQLSRDV